MERGSLREYDDGRPVVAMTYPLADAKLRALWLDLSPHPHIVDALDAIDDGALLLRYAALEDKPAAPGPQQLVAWGLQIIDAYQAILAELGPADTARFGRPSVRIDAGGAARLVFQPVEPVGPADERAVVEVIVAALRELGADMKPAATLAKLRKVWSRKGVGAGVRAGEQLASWMLAEEGLGWLALGQTMRAMDRFETALELDPASPIAEVSLHRAFAQSGIVSGSVSARPRGPAPPPPRAGYSHRPPPVPPLSWSAADAQGHELEMQRAFADALAVYGRAKLDGTHDASIHTAKARCYLGLAQGRKAVTFARHALTSRPLHVEALSILSRAHQLDHQCDEALAFADRWLAIDAKDPGAHYTRGRALLGLARFVEARDAFDRALALHPELLEAMLLRREANRALARLQAHLGTQPELDIEMPEHLAHLRDALVHGRIGEIITDLERPAHDADPEAKLILAHCLAYERRWADAIALYDRVAALSTDHERDAALGKAHVLLASGRTDEALAAFERLGDSEGQVLAALKR